MHNTNSNTEVCLPNFFLPKYLPTHLAIKVGNQQPLNNIHQPPLRRGIMAASQHSTSESFLPANEPGSTSSSEKFHELTLDTSELDDFTVMFAARLTCAEDSAELPPPVRFSRKRGRTSKTTSVKQDTEEMGSARYMTSDLRALRNRSVGQDLRQSECKTRFSIRSSGEDLEAFAAVGRDRPERAKPTSGMADDKLGEIHRMVEEVPRQPVFA
jgi:hypothetical protein